MFKKGDIVKMTADALSNYGDVYKDVPLTVTHVATKYMPAKEFFATGMPDGYHPGYDGALAGEPLYDVAELELSLYGWEVTGF